MDNFQPLDPRHHSHFEFLKTDLEMAITFTEIAQTTSSATAAARNRTKALEVHDRVKPLIEQFRGMEAEKTALLDLLEILKKGLSRLGEGLE